MRISEKKHPMNKIITFLFISTLFLLLPKHAKAQYIKVGMKAGFNYTNFNGFGGTYGSRDSFHAGLFLEEVMTDVLSFRFEGNYSQKGPSMYVSNSQGGKSQAVLKLHYLDLPALAKYQIVEDIYIFGGAQLSILLDKETKLLNKHESFVVNEIGSKAEVSGVIGASYDMFNRLTVDVRYSRGLLKLSPAGQKNFAFQASLGYLLFTR